MPGNQTARKSTNARIETSRVGERGAIVVPARMRKKFGIQAKRKGGLKGGKVRAAKLSPIKRRMIAQKAARAQWGA